VTTPEITSERFVRDIESGREVHVLDVRAPERLQTGRIDLVPATWFHNIRGSELLRLGDVRDAGLDPATPLAVVCGRGVDSLRIAEHLRERGYDANSIAGGMGGWTRALIEREIPAPPELDRFFQFDRIGKGALGYLLVCDGEALIVDPPRYATPYLARIDALGATLIGVADTHAHADYISGGPELAHRHDVPYYLHASDAISPYDGTSGTVTHTAVDEGTRIAVGRAEVAVLHTPGHTTGSVSYRVEDRFVLSGDFLFVHSVGRPDLGGKAEEWARVLWSSLDAARRAWPAEMEVFPGHYGSSAERRADRVVGSTMRELVGQNAQLRMKDAEEFIGWVRQHTGAFPETYRKIKTINIGLASCTDEEAEELEAGKSECALR